MKNVIWDCDDFERIGLDDVNFGIIKKNWNELKGDFMCFLMEF